MNINLTKITEAIPVNRLSIAVKVPKYAQVDDRPAAIDALNDLVEAIRDSDPPEKVLALDLEGVSTISESYRKALITTCKNALKKNVIVIDVWYDRKPTLDVKITLKEIRALLKTSNSHAVRIRKSRRGGESKLFAWFSYLTGLVLVVGGLFFDNSTVESQWINGVPPTVLIGAVLVVFGAIPQLWPYIEKFRKKQDV